LNAVSRDALVLGINRLLVVVIKTSKLGSTWISL